MPFNPDGTYSLVEEFGTGTGNDAEFPNKVGVDLDDLAASLNTSDPGDPTTLGAILEDQISALGALLKVNNLSDVNNVTTSRTNLAAAGLTQTDFISGIISSPTNFDFRIIEKIPYGATLTAFTAKLSSGTLTATLKINSTAVTNGAINATSSQQSVTPSALNVMSASDTLVLTVSAVSSPAALSFTIAFTRTLV